ncbi:MAG: hypothetical protein JOZ67_12435 [Gammaproteobacteria bacterium]|nr:hypothetical protein [Gammaproteobacteria bacterium]MBV9695409.1 hypothetical protein [Gammaproteobacteria bacterium]
MNASDIRKVKKLANRLGVRDSDVIRFAVKTTLARLSPLYDPEVHGRNLVPVFVESGGELLRFFDIDTARLESIINHGVEAADRVERDDVALLALTGTQEHYASLKLSELDQQGERRGRDLTDSVREYLYAKYLYRLVTPPAAPEAAERREALRLAGGTEHPELAEA